jgi:hypothetical protein
MKAPSCAELPGGGGRPEAIAPMQLCVVAGSSSEVVAPMQMFAVAKHSETIAPMQLCVVGVDKVNGRIPHSG